MLPEARGQGGLLESLHKLAGTFFAMAQTRLEIAAGELEEERARLGRVVTLATVTAFCVAFAVNLLILLVIVLFWDTHRLLVIGLLAAAFLFGALIAGLLMRSVIADRPRLLAVTLAELRKDREALERQ
jgi:uncharacterized membrane protein YqjE